MTQNISLNWQEQPSANDESSEIVVASIFEDNSDELILHAVLNTLDKAISMLDTNINDDSRYFLCEWAPSNASLTVVITDDSKTKDAKYAVRCSMSALENSDEAFVEELRHWIQNHLATHAGFMQYSLIASFHASSRQQSSLL